MSAVSNQSELYQKYIPDYQLSNCSDARVKNLEKRVDSIVKRIHREQTRFCCCSNEDIVNDLKQELNVTIKQRDQFYHEVVLLTQALEEARKKRAEMELNFQNKAVDAGLGFGSVAVASIFLGLNSVWSIACIAVGTIVGSGIGEAIRKTK